MRPGQTVILRRCYREGSINGGWRWHEHIAEITFLWKKTAMVKFQTNYGNTIIERVHISRIRPTAREQEERLHPCFTNAQIEEMDEIAESLGEQ